MDGPYDRSNMVAFYNHSVTDDGEGSRLIMNRYYFRPPAPLDFCSMPSLPPLESYECGVTGESLSLDLYSGSGYDVYVYIFLKSSFIFRIISSSIAILVPSRLLGIRGNLRGTKS